MAGSSGSLYTAFIDIGLKGLDKVQSYMKTAVAAVQSSTSQISNSFMSSQQAIHSFVGAANPLAMNTFSASVELLKARIGQSFTPYILQASKAVQDLGRWIKDLDPETKKQIANWVMYGTAAAGAFYALSKGLDVMKMLAANPLAMVLLGIGAAAIKVSQDMDRMTKSMDAAIEAGERMKKGVFTKGEYNRSAAGAIETDESMTKEQKLAKALKVRERLTDEVRSQSRAGANQGYYASAKDAALGAFGQTNNTEEQQSSIQLKLKEAGMIDELISRLKEGDKGPKFTAEADIAKRKGGDNRLMLGAMGGGQGGGGSTSLDSAYGRLNAGALGQNEIQREILKIQQESLLETRETAKDTSSILDMLKGAAGL